ncbi:MAG: response regulator [Flavobacteriales bacterium]
METTIQSPTFNNAFFIDDNQYTNEYHKAIAKELNLAESLLFYTNPNEALKQLKNIAQAHMFPELLVVDISMPQMDGHEFVEEVKQLPYYDKNRTCITYVTTSRDFQDALVADKLGVELLYWKPLDESLMQQISVEANETIKS